MRSLLPNALQHNETDHLPVLASEVRELLAVEPGETVVDATFGAGGHAALLAATSGKGRLVAIDRDPSRKPYFERYQRSAGRPVALPARLLRHGARPARGQRLPRRRDPLRPGDLEHAGRPARARLLLRRRCAARHAHGSVRAGVGAKELVNDADERELAELFRRYGEERFSRQIARAIVPAAGGASVRADGRPRRHDPFEPCLRPGGSVTATRPGASFRRSASW